MRLSDAVGTTSNEADLSGSSVPPSLTEDATPTPSLARRRRGPRSLEPLLDATRVDVFRAMTLAHLPVYTLTGKWHLRLTVEYLYIRTYGEPKTRLRNANEGKLIPIIESFFSGSDDGGPQGSAFDFCSRMEVQGTDVFPQLELILIMAPPAHPR